MRKQVASSEGAVASGGERLFLPAMWCRVGSFGWAWMLALAASLGTSEVGGQAVTLSAQETVRTETVDFRTDGETRRSHGEVLLEYQDGSLLFQTPDGQLYTLFVEDVLSREPSDKPLVPATSEEVFAQFKNQLDPGFAVYKTRNYVIIHNTSDLYVRWVGELFERLHRSFYNFWKSQRMPLQEPRFPLVAVVFRDKPSYLKFAEREIGPSARAMIGYYNLKTNRVVTYDLTGVNNVVPPGARLTTARITEQLRARPNGERTIATVVHEAVHQLAYNSGLQVRLADNPKWLSEGLATFFESPDFKSRSGWTMGKVNYHNFSLFAQYARKRPRNSLETLIADDNRFNDVSLARDAYGECWALTYHLMKSRKKEFVKYLQTLAELPPLGEPDPRERIETFRKHFGDLEATDERFLKFMRESVR